MKRGLILVLMVPLLFIPTVLRAADVPGVTDTEVWIGISSPLSGPAAIWGMTSLGAKAWADHVNDQGGVHGRKIKLMIKDDGYNPARALANFQEMKGKIFAGADLVGTASISACRDFFPENNLPLIWPLGHTRMWIDYPKNKLRYIFVSFPDYADEAEFLTKYALSNLGTKKLAFFHQNDDYGRLAFDGVNKALKENPGKADLAAAVSYEITDRALTTHALKLKESGADTVIAFPTPTHGALILKEMAKLGYKPKMMFNAPLGDPVMYTVAGKELWEGVYVNGPAGSGIPGAEPAADRVIEILKKYEPKIGGMEYMSIVGATGLMYAIQGLRNAGRNLTVENMIKGMEMIKDWKPEGMGAPVSFSPDRRDGVNGIRLMQAREGKHIPITDYVVFKPKF